MSLKNLAINGLLSLLSLFLTVLFAELILFRFVWKAPDLPTLDYVNEVVRYQPNQDGVYRIKNEIEATYNINSAGWNSSYDYYREEKTAGKYRIAVVGDSYVEALQVQFDQSLAEQLEAEAYGRFEDSQAA